MPKNAIIYVDHSNKRSRAICDAWGEGLRLKNVRVTTKSCTNFKGVEADIAIHYGLKDALLEINKAYSAAEGCHAVFIDLGYFGRNKKGQLEGYHRVTVDALHADLSGMTCDNTRVKQFQLTPHATKIKQDGYILLCGQSKKAAGVFGLNYQEWEKYAIKELQSLTDRQIVYRPKPSALGAPPLPGTTLSSKSLGQELKESYAVVTHHSNVGVDALIAGVPVFTVCGAARDLAQTKLSCIDQPKLNTVTQVQQMINNIAYTQWTIDEMRRGLVWDYLAMRRSI